MGGCSPGPRLADEAPVPRLQPPLLILVLRLLVLCLPDLQLPLQLSLQLPFPPWLLPLWPGSLALAILVPLPVPFPPLLTLPQPWPAAFGLWLPGRTPLLAFPSPARGLRTPAQK